ncbi:hypothetical protein FOL47_008964 [Perkinsus chesapeaki]|uniref:Uncharacterized protein n=1 Tax=Perkinsus chesapeaki TaxID=330153 RepID=A0A7J6N1W4_PERCH|nr:hypothetical protein FOL47_008964 [Perkinsus chesapeaki]
MARTKKGKVGSSPEPAVSASTSGNLLNCVSACPKTGRARIAIRAKPGAKVSCLAGVDATGLLGVQLNAPARDGEANEELIQFVAKTVLGVKKKDVTLIQGAKSREKVVEVSDVLTAVEVSRLLQNAIDSS